MKILILLSVLLFSGYANASQPGPNTYDAICFVVSERIDDPKQGSAGTVTILEHDGEIKFLTNAHVVDNNGYFKYLKFKDGRVRNFKIKRIDTRKDLALLEIDYPVKTKATKLSEQSPKRGQKVFCLGFGWNQYQVHSGRIIELKSTPESFLTDIPSISGTSGGPCIDYKNGHLMGIRNASGPGPNMSQTNVIDLETVKNFLEE
jgi:S1-C subfamily serine protease